MRRNNHTAKYTLYNRGQQLLIELAASEVYGTIREIARMVGLNENQVSSYARASPDKPPRVPRRESRLALRRVVPYNAWDQPPRETEGIES